MSEWVRITQLCLTLCDPMDCTVHGILQARILEWVAFPFSRGSSAGANYGQKDQKTQLPLLKSQSKSRVLCMPPAPNTTYRVVVSHPSGHSPTLTLWKELAHSPNGEQVSKGTCYLFSLCSLHRSPNRALAKFLVWPLHVCIFIGFRSVPLFATPWTIAHQAPLSIELSHEGHWSS